MTYTFKWGKTQATRCYLYSDAAADISYGHAAVPQLHHAAVPQLQLQRISPSAPGKNTTERICQRHSLFAAACLTVPATRGESEASLCGQEAQRAPMLSAPLGDRVSYCDNPHLFRSNGMVCAPFPNSTRGTTQHAIILVFPVTLELLQYKVGQWPKQGAPCWNMAKARCGVETSPKRVQLRPNRAT